MKKVVIDDSHLALVRTGQSISIELGLPAGIDNEFIRAYSCKGELIALLKYKELMEQWFPKKVFDLA